MSGIDVLIDVQAVSGEAAGVPNVARNLVSALLGRKDDLAYYVAGREDTLPGILSGNKPARSSVWLRARTRPAARVISQHFLDGFRVNRICPRVYFGPATLIPYGISSRTAKVSLIHDLAPFHLEGIYTPGRERYHRWLMRSVAKRSDHLVAISEATKKDLLEFLGVPESKVSVIPNATDALVYRRNPEETEQNRVRLRLPERFVLFVGKIQPRKNLVRLIEAFGSAGTQEGCKDVSLVMVGGKGWLDKDIRAAYERSPNRSRICFAGHVQDEDLPWYFRCAEVFCFPSLYEGFGLPLLEAMANGAPVASSRIGAMGEVVGDAGLTFDPYSVWQMGEAMTRLLRNRALREEFAERGYRRVQDFSWEHAAAQYVELWSKFK